MKWIMTSMVRTPLVVEDVFVRMDDSTNQIVITVTIVHCLLPILQVIVTGMASSTDIKRCLLWTSAISASVLVGKYQDAHEEGVGVVVVVVVVTHFVTSVRNYDDIQSVALMV